VVVPDLFLQAGPIALPTVGGRLFGGCALSGPDNVPALVLCEGELNAMSVWQTTCGAVDVLSMGSENAHLTDAAIWVILRYERVIV